MRAFLSRFRPRHKWQRVLLEILIMLALVLGVRAYMQIGTASGPAPALTEVMLDGHPVSLAGLRGEPVLVHFWASWCPICRAEEGNIAAVARHHRVLTVAMQSGDAAAVRRYMQERGWQVPTIVDASGALARTYGVRGTPTSFIIDGQGQIRFVEIGYTTEWGLRARLWLAGG
jgi:thiol-disulfide isomerase/thioredoxin